MGSEDPLAAVAIIGIAGTPGRLESMVQVSVATAVTTTATTASVLAAIIAADTTVIIAATAILIAAAIVVVASTVMIAACIRRRRRRNRSSHSIRRRHGRGSTFHKRAARKLGSHNAGTEVSGLQRGRTRVETVHHQGGRTGYGLLSLMAAREGIDRVIFHQAPPHRNPPLLTRPASELSTPNSYAEERSDEYSKIWCQAMGKEFSGQADGMFFWAV